MGQALRLANMRANVYSTATDRLTEKEAAAFNKQLQAYEEALKEYVRSACIEAIEQVDV